MVEKIYSKTGRMFLVERIGKSVYVAADGFSGMGVQLLVHDCISKTGLKHNKLQKNIANGMGFYLIGVGFRLPLLGKKKSMQKVREVIANYHS